MKTINRELLAEFSELVFDMMQSNEPFDMAVVECITEDFMEANGLTFKDYTDFLIEVDGNEEAKYWMNFESTSDYFFDTINSKLVTKSRIKGLIEMTVIF